MQALSHPDRDPASDPTGEELLDRARLPFKFWVPDAPALVIGHSQDPHRELNAEAVLRDGIPVHRRMGGGGAVFLSPACLCVGIRFARHKGRTLHEYFEAGSDLIRRAVTRATGLELVGRGISDLAFPDPKGLRKVVGCSLYMPRDFALYLASILVEADHGAMEAYLAHPSREPDYREGRTHRQFLAGLAELRDGGLQAGDLLPHFQAVLEIGLKAELDWPSARSGLIRD
jgi:lipoate---protein ligase